MSEDKKTEIVLQDERGTNLFSTNPDDIHHNIVAIATKTDIMTPEDKKFFMENSQRWQAVQTNCHIWRTRTEKESILFEQPTTHAKFHQAILENKVFIDETVRLAKEAEIQKLEAEELHADIENLKDEIQYFEEELSKDMEEKERRNIKYQIRKKDIELRKKMVELQEKAYNIQQSSIAMKYRVDELKDWKAFEDELIQQMLDEGYTEEEIWNKNAGQEESFFLLFLTKYHGVATGNVTDGGEKHNLTYLAQYAIQKAISNNNFENFLKRCNLIQLESLKHLGYVDFKRNQETGKVDVDILFKLPEKS